MREPLASGKNLSVRGIGAPGAMPSAKTTQIAATEPCLTYGLLLIIAPVIASITTSVFTGFPDSVISAV